MVARLISGITALVFLPLGVAFTLIGLLVDDIDEGDPVVFLYIGVPFLLVGLTCAFIFVRLWRRERARRARRRAGLRASAEVVSAQYQWNVRVNGRPALNLTVRIGDRTVSGMFLAKDLQPPTAGSSVDVLYDPADPSNFEPAPA
jgi:hypothetical protein